MTTIYVFFIFEQYLSQCSCPDRFYGYENYCYRVFGLLENESIQDYWEAKKTCNNHEGNLLTIKSEETSQELSFILEIFYKAEEDHSFWIGLNDNYEEGVFRWESPELDDKVHRPGDDFNQWQAGEPDNGTKRARNGKIPLSENCVVWKFSEFPKWDDILCNLRKMFICETKLEKNKKESFSSNKTTETQVFTESFVDSKNNSHGNSSFNYSDDSSPRVIEETLKQVSNSSVWKKNMWYIVGGGCVFLVIVSILVITTFTKKRKTKRLRKHQIGVLKQTGLYPGMSSYRQNRYNLSNNNMTIPQALLPPVKIVYLPLSVQEAPNQHQKDNNKLKIESLE